MRPFGQAKIKTKETHGRRSAPEARHIFVRAANAGEGMYGLGSSSYSEAMIAGRKFVGDGFRASSRDPNIWISQDGLRQFRAPSYKPKLDLMQANFQSRAANSGGWSNNGHLIIGGR